MEEIKIKNEDFVKLEQFLASHNIEVFKAYGEFSTKDNHNLVVVNSPIIFVRE